MTGTNCEQERGLALLMALFFTIVAMGLIVAGALTINTHRTYTETNFRHNSQAMQFARSGLTEAATWFRRQTSQPVLQFEPRVDPTASPPIHDTEEPELGLVREFRITGKVWGRYEVWKSWPDDPEAERARLRQRLAVRDVSIERGYGARGAVWRLRAIGYVFIQEDPNRRFDAAPNHVVSTKILETEILRLKLAPPSQAALCTRIGGLCSVEGGGRIRGGSTGAGVYCTQETGLPSGAGEISGSPGVTAVRAEDYDASVTAVFGAPLADLESVADDVVTQPGAFPDPLPPNGLIIARAGTLTFDAARPLRGAGILYVQGDVVVQSGSASNFTGLLYIDGSLILEAPAELTGAVVISDGGSVTIRGAGDWAQITHDDGILLALRREIGQYRMSGAMRPLDAED